MPTETPYKSLQQLESELLEYGQAYAFGDIDKPEYERAETELKAQIYGIHLRSAKTDLAREIDGLKHYNLMQPDQHSKLIEQIRTARTIEQVKEIATFKRPNQ